MIFIVAGFYAAWIGGFLPAFENNLTVSSSMVKQSGCPEMSAKINTNPLCVKHRKSDVLLYSHAHSRRVNKKKEKIARGDVVPAIVRGSTSRVVSLSIFIILTMFAPG